MMTSDLEQTKVILLEIIQDGLLQIRAAAEIGDIELCRIEANHLHNLPSLIKNFSLDLLGYYIDVEAKQYLREAEGKIRPAFNSKLESLKQIRKEQ